MKKVTYVLFSLLLLTFLSSCASVQESMFNAGISAERLLSGMDEAFVTVQGQKIAYLERQGSGETIVLLHGFGANKDNWIRFTRSLPKEYRVIAFDLPGHGDTSKENDKTYTIDFITQGFADAADAIKLDRFHLAGNSMGGWVGILYTNRNPERIITLGLFDTAGINSPEPSDLVKAIEKGRNILIPTSEDAFKELMGYAFYKEPFIPWPAPSVLARKSVADAPFKQKMWNGYPEHLQRRSEHTARPEAAGAYTLGRSGSHHPCFFGAGAGTLPAEHKDRYHARLRPYAHAGKT